MSFNYKEKSLPLEIVKLFVKNTKMYISKTPRDGLRRQQRVKRRIFSASLPVTELRNLIIRRTRLAPRENEDENIRLSFQALLGGLHKG